VDWTSSWVSSSVLDLCTEFSQHVASAESHRCGYFDCSAGSLKTAQTGVEWMAHGGVPVRGQQKDRPDAWLVD